MKYLGILAVAALLAAAPVASFADTGGQPNANATTQTGNGDPNGRKGTCIVPGSLIRQVAKQPGSTKDGFGGNAPGQLVSAQCTPNPS